MKFSNEKYKNKKRYGESTKYEQCNSVVAVGERGIIIEKWQIKDPNLQTPKQLKVSKNGNA